VALEEGPGDCVRYKIPPSDYFLLIQDILGTKSIFLPFMCRLRFFEIHVHLGSATLYDFNILSFLMRSLCISLTSPATLEHLEFNVLFRGTILNRHKFYKDLRDADAWSHLDSITTHPDGSQLQRVDINIRYNLRDYRDNGNKPHEHEVLEAVLRGLPLLRMKDILFIEAFSGHSQARARYVPSIAGSVGYCDVHFDRYYHDELWV
jgi:hypothetical protein